MASSKKKKSANKKLTKKPVKKAAVKKAALKLKKTAPKKVVAKKTAKAPISKSTSKTATSTKIVFTPLQNHLLVKQEGESDRTPGGLYIPAIAQDKPQKGKVVAVGKGSFSKKGKLRPLDVKAGETILFAPHAGSKVTLSGQELIVIREDEVLGVVKA